MPKRRLLIAGNWKMNGNHNSITDLVESIKQGANGISHCELAVFPPYVYLDSVARLLKDSSITFGAQNVSNEDDGAYTGEISVQMLKDMNCRYVIVGHSERRALYHETSEIVAKKFHKALQLGLTPILCVGETLAEREAGKTLSIVEEQLEVVMQMSDNLPAFESTVVAYEPVWAIGTGKTATPEQAQEVHSALRQKLGDTIRILYGGSVKPENAATLSAMPDIDGALVGGASLNATNFIEIAKQWNN